MGRKRKRLADDVTSVTSSVCSRTADGRTQPASSPDGDSAQDDGPAPRNAANERERARMRVLSRAFTRLKTSLPWVPADTKLSKLDTLRLASCYIAHLSRLLAEDDDIKSGAVSSGTGTAGAGTDDVHSSTAQAAAAVATSSTANVHPISLVSSLSHCRRGLAPWKSCRKIIITVLAEIRKCFILITQDRRSFRGGLTGWPYCLADLAAAWAWIF